MSVFERINAIRKMLKPSRCNSPAEKLFIPGI